MNMSEFFHFVNGFWFSSLCLIFWWANGQLWKSFRIFGIFFIQFSKFEYEDDAIFQFCKRIQIPRFMLDFLVGDRTTLKFFQNFENFFRVYSKFWSEDVTFMLFSLQIRILWFFCYFLVWEWTTLKVFIFSSKLRVNYSNVI